MFGEKTKPVFIDKSETKQDKLISHIKTFSESFTNHEKKLWKLKIQELVDDFDRK